MTPGRTLQKYKMTPSGRNINSFLRVLLYLGLAYQRWKTAKITKFICKKRKKLLTNAGTDDNIMKLSERDGEKHKTSIERLENK